LYDEALVKYEKALSLKPDHKKAQLNIEAVDQIKRYGERAQVELVY